MTAYCIANVEVHSPDIYETYRQHTFGTVQKFGGRFIVRGGDVQLIEGSWMPTRLIVIEFASMDDLCQWYRSPEYQSIIAGRHDGARTDLVFVEGAGTR